ncbi:hypothetical protein I5535_18550 [Rhodobacteraceae bacterium F11138]|nr:hypothetical protein [Rhodobacteraceae bacterium F11138]
MSELRDAIRAILREELAALRSETGPAVETVRISSSSDLNRFAQDLLSKAQDPGFAAQVQAGQLRYELAGGGSCSQLSPRPAIVSSPPGPAGTVLDKKLVTESDIAALNPGTIRLPKHTRLTPLAQDEARRKGIRIERIEA